MYKKSQKNITLEFTPGSFAVQPQSAITFLGVTSLVEELSCLSAAQHYLLENVSHF